MKPSWCASLPVLSVPQSDQPKPVTLIKPYFENPKFLASELSRWRHHWPESVKPHLSCIVVDDCSEWPASDVLVGADLPVQIRLFRILKKVRWNWIAARNIGAHEAKDGWLLLTDMDHVVPHETAQAVVYGAHDPSVVYVFSRVEGTGTPIHPHSASFLMTKAMFWKIGGYSEEFSGFYGSDGQYRRRLQAMAPVQLLRDRLVRHENDGDSSTVAFQRKTKADIDAIQRIAASIPTGAKPKVLSFEYQEVVL